MARRVRCLANFGQSCVTRPFSAQTVQSEPEIKKLFIHKLDASESENAMKNAHRSVRGNVVDSRRIYWFNIYLKLLQFSRLLLVVQNNNLTAQNYKAFKNEAALKGLECLAVRNAVFGAACAQTGKQELRNLFQGPTLVIFSSASDSQAPDLIKNAASLLKKQTTNTMLVGGFIDDFIFSAQKFKEIEALPPKIQILGELLGLIQFPASTIAQMLSQTPQVLAASLEQYQNKK